MKPLTGLLLCALLALTGQSMAVARGAAASTGQMVICTGAGLTTVYMDAEGRPTSAPHICPDCILVFCDAPDPLEIHQADVTFSGLQHPAHSTQMVPTQTDKGFHIRAPPELI